MDQDQAQQCRERANYFRALAAKATSDREALALGEVAASWERTADEQLRSLPLSSE